MKRPHFRFYTLLIISLYSTGSQAQIDITTLDLSGDVTHWFDSTFGRRNTKIVSGSYQQEMRVTTNSHQFFEDGKWSNSSISYYGQVYENVNALYDLEMDLVLIRYPTGFAYYSQPISLHQDKVSAFSLYGHDFSYYHKEDNPPAGVGFYDELFLGEHIDLIVRRRKEKKVKTGDSYLTFESANKYFIKVDNVYHRVYRKSSITKVLISYKKQLNRFVRQNHLKVKDGYDFDMVRLMSYYESLVKDI